MKFYYIREAGKFNCATDYWYIPVYDESCSFAYMARVKDWENLSDTLRVAQIAREAVNNEVLESWEVPSCEFWPIDARPFRRMCLDQILQDWPHGDAYGLDGFPLDREDPFVNACYPD